jgi:hypothetical protein
MVDLIALFSPCESLRIPSTAEAYRFISILGRNYASPAHRFVSYGVAPYLQSKEDRLVKGASR